MFVRYRVIEGRLVSGGLGFLVFRRLLRNWGVVFFVCITRGWGVAFFVCVGSLYLSERAFSDGV